MFEYCLSSGKPLTESEREQGWSKARLAWVFGTSALPDLELDDASFRLAAERHVSESLTVPGVQKKLSLGLSKKGKGTRLTIVDYPTGFILKPQADIPNLPESENLVMQLAEIAGIETVPHGLIPMRDGSLSYIVRRVDRTPMGKMAMEDFCQLSGRLTEQKYSGSYEACKKVLSSYSSRVGADVAEFFYRLLFCFLTLNSDMHLKNFSLIETDHGYVLSPAYDLLPVNLVFPADQDETALTLNGKKKNIRWKDFLAFASSGVGRESLSSAAATKMAKRLLSYREAFVSATRRCYLPQESKRRFVDLMGERFDRIQAGIR